MYSQITDQITTATGIMIVFALIGYYHSRVKPKLNHWKPKSRLAQRIRASLPF